MEIIIKIIVGLICFNVAVHILAWIVSSLFRSIDNSCKDFCRYGRNIRRWWTFSDESIEWSR